MAPKKKAQEKAKGDDRTVKLHLKTRETTSSAAAAPTYSTSSATPGIRLSRPVPNTTAATNATRPRWEELQEMIDSRQEQIAAFAEAVARKHEEVKEKIMQMLWSHYCHLPNGGDTPKTVQKACQMRFEGGKMVPARPVPDGWMQAVEKNLADMMEACGKKVTDFTGQPEFYAEEMNMRVLTPMREIAVELVHLGAYKGSDGREKLGVLAEVLGLEVKGTIWKG